MMHGACHPPAATPNQNQPEYLPYEGLTHECVLPTLKPLCMQQPGSVSHSRAGQIQSLQCWQMQQKGAPQRSAAPPAAPAVHLS